MSSPNSSTSSSSPYSPSFVLDYTGRPSTPVYYHSQEDLPSPTEYVAAPVPNVGIAYQVHHVFQNIQDNFKDIMNTLGGPVDIYILNIGPSDFMVGLDEFFVQVINNMNENEESRSLHYEKIRLIEEKLDLAGSEVLTRETTNNMFTWIQFVLRQPVSFQQHYIDCFVRDTYHAYDGSRDTISCPKGIYERLFLAIGDACVLYCTLYKKPNKKQKTKKKKNSFNMTRGGGVKKSTFHRCDNPVYRKLIRLFKKEVPDMNDLTKEWSVIFCSDTNELSAIQLKQNFIDFMDAKYKMYGLNHMKAIQKRADELEEAEIFERREF